MRAVGANFRSLRAKSRSAAERSRGCDSRSARRRFSTALEPNGWVGLVLLLTLLPAAAPAFAQSQLPPAAYADTQLSDSRKEAEARALMETLRCIVCQGQSIADSNADMAGDMRALVRRRIEAGERPEEIRRWLIERYGNWVSYAPPVEPATWPLWGAPVVLILVGLLLARGRFRRGKKVAR